MKCLGLVLALYWVSSSINISAQSYYKLDSSLIIAYDEIQILHLDNAKNILDSYKKTSHDPLVYIIENYIDFYTLFIGENIQQYNLRIDNKSQRINQLKISDKNNPYNRFGRALIYTQWALVNIKFESYFTAFRDISRAYKLLNENEKLYPDFKANKMILGVIHALIGTIPDNYKWAVNLLGFKGTIKQGNHEIESVLILPNKDDFLFINEAIVLYTMVNLHLKNDQQKAWEILNKWDFSKNPGPLACFISSNVAMRTYKNDLAIKTLFEFEPDENAFPLYHLELMKGTSLLRKLNPESKTHILAYVENYHGKSYIKESYLYLAWQDLLFAEGRNYHHWMELCKTKGALQTDEDKNAFWEAQSSTIPHKILLKSRLLFDGGYWNEAKTLLFEEIFISSLTQDQLIEFHYRLARIEEMLGNIELALEEFSKVIKLNVTENYLYCSSHLHMGNIYEKNNNIDDAQQSYKSCLELSPNRYQTGLHQKAMSGLNRLADK